MTVAAAASATLQLERQCEAALHGGAERGGGQGDGRDEGQGDGQDNGQRHDKGPADAEGDERGADSGTGHTTAAPEVRTPPRPHTRAPAAHRMTRPNEDRALQRARARTRPLPALGVARAGRGRHSALRADFCAVLKTVVCKQRVWRGFPPQDEKPLTDTNPKPEFQCPRSPIKRLRIIPEPQSITAITTKILRTTKAT